MTVGDAHQSYRVPFAKYVRPKLMERKLKIMKKNIYTIIYLQDHRY